MIVRWVPLAEQDLGAVYDYVWQDNPEAAKQIVASIFSAVGMLMRHPRAGREGRVNGSRKLAIARTPYVIAYRIRENEIQILAVIHRAQQWPTSFTSN